MPSFKGLAITFIVLSLFTNPTFSISNQISNPTVAGNSLLADAHFAGDQHSVQLNRPNPSSYGIILHNPPFNFTYATSFSSNFTFKIGNGIALVIIPSGFPSNFEKFKSFEVLDVNRIMVVEFRVNVCNISFPGVDNVSKSDNVLKDGVKLTAWISYRAVFRRLDVMVGKFDDDKPVKPLVSYRVNLGKKLNGKEVLFGLVSGNGNNEKASVTNVYSWTSEVEGVPKWMHSIPIIPKEYVKKNKEGCFLSGFVFATGCGALAALVLLFVWSYVADRKKVEGDCEECVRQVEFKYEKIGVVEGKNSGTGMKK
uniref:L-type lectin-domain containing receptor kinase S.4-like n=1 Tax=Erigeron canadensis TaxID=72917 RepID=UPI001CB97891|nr:L-type lectin-domain containing receptor kinase S.4-like [Erigeron canadensis]